MKKTILFTFLVLTSYAYSQNKQPKAQSPILFLTETESLREGMTFSGNEPDHPVSEFGYWKALVSKKRNELTLIQQFDSVANSKLDVPNMEWKPESRFINIHYDNSYNLTGYLEQTINGSAWVNLYNHTYFYTFDDDHYKLEYRVERWTDGTWVNSTQTSYIYNDNFNVLQYIIQNWIDSAWVNDEQILSSYDSNDNLIFELLQDWEINKWVNAKQGNYTYDANNNLTNLDIQSWDNGWINLIQGILSYNSDQLLTKETDRIWNGSAWDNYAEYTYTYNASNDIESELVRGWTGSYWQNYAKTNCYYENSVKMTSAVQQLWNGSAWVISWQQNYTYDANNFMTSEIKRDRDIVGGGIVRGTKTDYYFHTAVAGVRDMSEADIRIYPNPGRGSFTLSSRENITSVEVYNLFGEQVYTDFKVVKQPTIQFDLSHFPKGIYFVKINRKSHSCNRSILVQ
ncbi:MAG: hypothetical protein CVT99_15070 [Bacteroidetes bacterium HGW-Bacteroidetes-16]|jgi:hypothetical protein|nr:MAG: hypothetical protein CVT99_15070 [Bacteroidetes bacterium HGW-Bacteroidetes-16]